MSKEIDEAAIARILGEAAHPSHLDLVVTA